MKTNYHTHTDFCDGAETPEAMVQAALEKQFDVLGFSGHSMYPFAADWHIAPRAHADYVQEIHRLADVYRDRIEILCGFEVDYLPGISVPHPSQFAPFKPDFLIGSVHYIVTDSGNFTVDDTAENVRAGIERCFGGNAREAVCTYFSLERDLLREATCTFLGHCDLFRKRNGVLHLFDERDSWYRDELRATATAIAHSGVIVEINTGAITRGAMDDVYPSAEFLSLLAERGVPITISSDAHRGTDLDGAFDRAVRAAKAAGYTEMLLLTSGRITSQKLPTW
ncbi:MAG: histidinol-phosphatase [Treponema sp.]|nr:histidinol-phosphatase [Treponema sp.]